MVVLLLAFLQMGQINQAWATAPLFEAYHKILSGGVPTGYVIARYESDAKGNLTATTFTRTNTMGGDITESIRAACDKKFQPISYSFTSKVGDSTKIIDGVVKGQKMEVKITENGKSETKVVQLQKGVFLSQFLVYLMLTNPKGLAKGLKYNFKAIAEELGSVEAGEAYVDSTETYKGVTVFKILNTFNGTKFISLVTSNGEIMQTRSPLQGVSVEMVANREEATTNLPFDTKTVALVFGQLPEGKVNTLAKAAEKQTDKRADKQTEKPTDTASPNPTEKAAGTQDKLAPAAPGTGKGADIAPGQGLHTKPTEPVGP